MFHFIFAVVCLRQHYCSQYYNVKKIIILIIAGIYITGCKQKISVPKPPQIQPQKNFFPVTQYLLGQIKELKSLPVTPLKVTTFNSKSDSVWIKREEINSFILPFITPEIDSVSLSKYFSERSFLDQTINAFTFSYDPVTQLPDSIIIKHWDVYVDPDNNEVKRIYIIKQLNKNDSPQTIQLTWKSGNYCQVTTILEKEGTAAEIKEEKLIWNF